MKRADGVDPDNIKTIIHRSFYSSFYKSYYIDEIHLLKQGHFLEINNVRFIDDFFPVLTLIVI